MRRIFTLALVSSAILISAFRLISIDEVVSALKTGNAAGISKYFDNTVEITLPGKSSSYSKSQAEVIITDFFNNNPVKNFELMHKGENAGSIYCIGTLITKTGSFRTTVFMKQKGGVYTLQEIRFETR